MGLYHPEYCYILSQSYKYFFKDAIVYGKNAGTHIIEGVVRFGELLRKFWE